MDYQAVNDYLLDKLNKELPASLTYHNVSHTKDVIETSMFIAGHEGVEDWEELLLLKTAALFHDAGFLYNYKDHERVSCEIASDILPSYDYGSEEIDHITDMIMATKQPQTPQDFLAKILCDADLDYLGRPDYYPKGEKLFNEFRNYGMIEDERDWNVLEVSFIGNHQYFTETANRLREQRKQRHLQEMRNLTEGYQEE